MATKQQCRDYRQCLKKRAFDAIGRVCVFCESEEEIHAAHVLPTGLKGSSRGLDRRFRDVIKNPKCYRPMCKKCHRIFDALVKLVKPDPIVEEDPIPF